MYFNPYYDSICSVSENPFAYLQQFMKTDYDSPHQ